jgi:hypothetical protein
VNIRVVPLIQTGEIDDLALSFITRLICEYKENTKSPNESLHQVNKNKQMELACGTGV